MSYGRFKRIFLGIVFIALIVFLYLVINAKFGHLYDKNAFIIKVNNQEVSYIYDENYYNVVLFNNEKIPKSYDYNDIYVSDKYILEFKEYELYANGIRQEYRDIYDGIKLKEVNNNAYRLVIKKGKDVLYDGKYMSDISSYIKDSGRYNIHIYNKRRLHILSSVKSHISFSIVVGDDI